MSIHDANPAATEPGDFARLVKRTPVEDLRNLMTGERRCAVLDELFRRMPDVFRADRASSLDAVIHWVIGDRPDGGTDRYELTISNGVCRVSPAPTREPRLTLTIGAVDFLHVVTGNAHPVILVMKGKLHTKGDMVLTAKFPSLFDVPKV
ncbi:SCP2 sterol-binding domain-containing protein [Dactylosporangium sp. NPDC051484]|uniref:SCP2 sterol-binding domain-containing protein n=1 Tax=Dactylosporangium sp. NPDC051484 TaxID=3154942 RepID=UPI0034508572